MISKFFFLVKNKECQLPPKKAVCEQTHVKILKRNHILIDSAVALYEN